MLLYLGEGCLLEFFADIWTSPGCDEHCEYISIELRNSSCPKCRCCVWWHHRVEEGLFYDFREIKDGNIFPCV